MSADGIALGIAAAGGFLVGSLVWLHVCGLFLSRIRRRAEKETWASARRYYEHRTSNVQR
jgi:biotin transporter BioY